MNNTEESNAGFLSYEYKERIVPAEKASFFMDCYESFGWHLDENMEKIFSHHSRGLSGNLILRFKRNRKIINKMELTRLQRNFEACLHEIDELEKSKTSAATVTALITGLIGTVFMALSVFAVVSVPPKILLCIVFAIPGFIGWILPFFLYRKIAGSTAKKIAPYIEAKYDEIYELCEKGNKLLL